MLYGIISDIHGNLEALGVVLYQLRNVEKLICLGDIVGYGPNPNECVEKVRELEIPTLAGNHDRAATGDMALSWFNRNARDAVIWTQKELTKENIEYLKKLPLILDEGDFHIVHGSLRAPLEEYITSFSEALPTFERMEKPLCFVGHSHIPLFIAMNRDGSYDGRELLDKEEVRVGDYQKVIINVGGVGQPRDRDPRASFGIYNSETRIFTLRRVEYNIEKVQQKMETAGLPIPLIERLRYGR
jgi:diadenosine tetraphosphatase ApaH/serine/threonine PP2A family protein phosphatase